MTAVCKALKGKVSVPGSPLIFTLCALLLASCGGSSGIDQRPTVRFQPVQVDSPYKDVLVGCIDPKNSADICQLSRLPYIGQSTNSPTKADILARTVSSHAWMATRFSELLDKMPNDILLLFRGVTGVAIGATIRPSYYDASTGAIYLDPADLWLNQEERSTISRAPDYRESFGRELQFVPLWRYVKDSDYAWDEYSLTGPINGRSIDAIVLPMAALLFHELAHANDIAPPALMAQVNPQNTPEAQATLFMPNFISTGLHNNLPLTSTTLSGLANVLYQGAAATDAQKALTATQVGLEFAVDGASENYAYSSQFEDAAMLFEEVMMKYHFNVDRDIAFTDAPTAANAPCSAYTVRWGMRNRIGDETVKARAKIVVQQLLGRSDAAEYFTDIPAPLAMRNGYDWCVNISSSSENTAGLEKMSNRLLHNSDFHPPH